MEVECIRAPLKRSVGWLLKEKMKRSELPQDAPIRGVKDWPSLLEEIRLRPGMWIGKKSIVLMEAQIRGIWLAESLYEIEDQNRLGGFSFVEFEEWAERYNIPKLSILSFGVAYRQGNSDEDAFDLWFSWYDQYRKEASTEPK